MQNGLKYLWLGLSVVKRKRMINRERCVILKPQHLAMTTGLMYFLADSVTSDMKRLRKTFTSLLTYILAG